MAVFDGVRYSLSSSFSPARRDELASLLDLNGAVPDTPHTHLITLLASHPHVHTTTDSSIKLVTDRWVDRSVVLGKCQPEQYYSPDPSMIFSGVVACATDLAAADLEVLSAGISALGGQWRVGLTRDVTHLFALRAGTDKYNTALHFSPQTHMCVLTPHWFDDSVRLGRRVPEAPYSWPDPLVLRPGVSLDLDDDALADGKRKRKSLGGGEAADSTSTPHEGENTRVWAGRRILLSVCLELSEGSRSAIEAGIQRAGGALVAIAEDADEDAEEKAVGECDVFVTRWRSGKPYFKAARASLLIGTLTWLFSVESSGTLHSPLDSLLWYPTPRGGIPELVDCEISVTNYTGAARDYIKRLIALLGAKFTPSMSQANKVLVAGFQPSPKATRALAWNIPIVNHTWLEDCLVEWRALTVGLERYIVFPPGVDFGEMLMTRQDAPPSSQAVSVLRVSGGVVPGGRGVGVINLEKEEARDAEHRARAGRRESTGHRPTSESPTDARDQSRSRAESAKKTSALGVFVDHVIDLRAEGGAGRQRIPVLDPFPTAMEDGVAGRRAEQSSKKGGKEKVGEREKAKGKNDVATRRPMQPASEADSDAPVRTRSPKPKSRRISGKSDGRAGQTENQVEKQAPAKTSKPGSRVAKRITVGSESESHREAMTGDESDRSVPPRRAMVAVSTTPVRSGMKPKPRSKSMPGHNSVPIGESEEEVTMLAADFGMGSGLAGGQEPVGKPARDGERITKDKGKEKAGQGKEKEVAAGKTASRRRSPSATRSPLTSPDAKHTGAPKRRLSVLIPSVPKDYFSSQSVRGASEAEEDKSDRERPRGKKGADGGASLVPGRKQPASAAPPISAPSAEVPLKRKPGGPRKSSTTLAAVGKSDASKVKPKSKPGVRKETTKTRAREDDGDEDGDEDEGDTSMVAESSMNLSSRGGPRRGAADKASARLREVMPDVINFENEQKKAKRKRSMDWESTASVRGKAVVELEERNGKRIKASKYNVEEEEEAEVEVAVLAPSTKAKPKQVNGKRKGRGSMTGSSDVEMDDPPAKNKPSGSNERKGGRGQEKRSVIRVMTTGVSLSDEVVKRLTKLGVQMTTKPPDCTHLIARGIVRTEKFLCALPVSLYFLTEAWANACAMSGKLLPERDYLLSDPAAEEKWGFKFTDALARAKGPEGGSSLFKSMTFYVTPKVAVDAKLLRNVVAAGGGQVQTSTLPTTRILNGKANRYVVSCEEDKAIWRPLVQEGLRVYSPELVLRGALRQEVEWEREECVVAG